ncbi:MAG: F0F1 ATP synthase subunit A [Bacteroidales bacterium]|nr:F0F1 ATP synthase subunit A [Bacteroidales bacterium]
MTRRDRILLLSLLLAGILCSAYILSEDHGRNASQSTHSVALQPEGEGSAKTGKKEFNARKVIVDHVLDSYDWHLFDIGQREFSIPLPVILIYEGKLYVFSSSRFDHGYSSYKGFRLAAEGHNKGRAIRVMEDGITPDPDASMIYDFSITKNVAAIIAASVILCLIFIHIGNKYRKADIYSTPKGLPAFFEPLILFVRDQIALLAIAPRHYRKFMPYLLTVFFFILLNNLLGLVPFFPGGANVTGNISVTFVLAMFTFFTTHWFANKGYWQHMFNMPGIPMFLKFPIPILPVLEMVGALIKPFTLMIRLFANITAGHMVILSLTSLIFVLGSVSIFLGYVISPLTVLFLIFLNFLKILVAFLQAYIFTLFSAFFFGMAVPEEHH